MELEKLASIFESVRIAPLRESDLLVFRTVDALTLQQMADLHVALEEQTGHARILILTGGADLAIIRPEAEPDREAPAQPTAPELLPNGKPKVSTVPGGLA